MLAGFLLRTTQVRSAPVSNWQPLISPEVPCPRRPPAKSACLEGPVLEAHIGTLHSPAVSHLLSDTTFPQLGILSPGTRPYGTCTRARLGVFCRSPFDGRPLGGGHHRNPPGTSLERIKLRSAAAVPSPTGRQCAALSLVHALVLRCDTGVRSRGSPRTDD